MKKKVVVKTESISEKLILKTKQIVIIWQICFSPLLSKVSVVFNISSLHCDTNLTKKLFLHNNINN